MILDYYMSLAESASPAAGWGDTGQGPRWLHKEAAALVAFDRAGPKPPGQTFACISRSARNAKNLPHVAAGGSR